jgi:UDP-2,3-diacylglucosamine hydrolase
MATYFISDLHLHANSKLQMELLCDLLNTRASNADAIYILGDLFALWLGDDLEESYSQDLITQLKKLAQRGIPLYFMPGNRDFLVGKKFCHASGCTLLPDPHVIDLYGEKVLLTHGDKLCTADKNYQRFRKIVQNPLLKKFFLAIPRALRRNFGIWIKNKVQQTPKRYDPNAYDVELTTVAAWFKNFAVKTMIHGHTHRPVINKDVDGTTRIVLGDWNQSNAQILVVTPDQKILLDLHRFFIGKPVF